MQNKITQAVILCAGFGTRLRPLTETMPKQMLPLLGKPLLEWHIEQLKQYGVHDFFINLFYLPEVVQNYFGDGSRWGVKITYCVERPEILGTAGGIKDFDGKLRGDFFVIYGDVFNEIDYSKMIAAYFEKPHIIAMEVVGDTDHPHDSDLVSVDANLKFLKIYPKPHKELPATYRSMRAAAFIMNEKILSSIPAGTYYEIDHQLLPDLLSRGELIYGFETSDFIKDIGTTERYQFVEKYLQGKGVAY